MAPRVARKSVRRKPTQQRARQTVDAILDAIVRVLKRGGVAAVTTNRIAEIAGVSIGSVYQYFPDKQAIFVALHRRHIEQIDRMVASKLVQHATSPLEVFIRAMIDGMIEAHVADPELYALLVSEVPHRADGTRAFSQRTHGAFRLAISSRACELRDGSDLDRTAFMVAEMVESLSHAVLLRRPANLSLANGKREIARVVISYLRS